MRLRLSKLSRMQKYWKKMKSNYLLKYFSYLTSQSAAQSCLGTFELRVLPFGKTSGTKLLNLLNRPTNRTFGNRPMKKVRPCTFFIPEFCLGKTLKAIITAIRGGEIGKKVPQAYRVYVEDTFLPCDAGDPALNDYIPIIPILEK